MLLVSIVHAKEGGVAEYVHNNAPIAIQNGDKVVCDTKMTSLTSAIREGDDLHITIDRVVNYIFTDFFAKESVALSFEDAELDQAAVTDLFVISMIIRHEDKVDRQLEATPNSVIEARGGDHFEIFEGNASIHDFRRVDKNMIVTFKHPIKNIESTFTLRGFFAEIASGQERPVIVLADRNHKPMDIFLQPNRNLIEWEGEIPTIMTSGVLYSFIFSLIGVDFSKVQVEAVLDGKPLPGWLSLSQLSASKYMLHGMPPKEFQGKPNIEIIIHEQGDGVKFHSQQAFNLSVFRSEFYERSMATWIVQAEIRGAVSSNVSEAFAVSSSMSASFTPMLVVASVSSLSTLSVLGKPMMIDPNFGSFNFANGLFELNMNEAIKVDIAPEASAGGKETGQFGGELGGAGGYNMVTQIGSGDIKIETAQEAIPLSPAAFQLSASSLLHAGLTNLNTNTLSGEFALVPDRVEVFEDSPLIVFKPGLLMNDINTQNPDFFFVVQVNKTILNLRGVTPIPLESGAIVFAGINGQFIYDPRGQFEYLNVNQTATDTFSYVATNTLQFAHVIVTVTINGQNDAPIAFNDAFSSLEDPVLPMNVFSNHGSGADFDIDNGSSFTIAQVNGTTNVGVPVLLPSGALVTLNANGTGNFDPNGVYDHLAQGVVVIDRFTYSIIDENGAMSVLPATVTITITGVNDKPVTMDDSFVINENGTLSPSALRDVRSNDHDVDDGAVITVHEVNGVVANVGNEIILSSGAKLTLLSNGRFTYNTNGQFESLNVGETTTDTFTYRLHDQFGAISGPAAAVVTITITGVNDAPVARADTFGITEDASVGGNLFANNGSGIDFDIDHLSSFTVGKVNGLLANVGSQITLPSGALLTVNSDGTFSYDTHGAFNHLAQGVLAVDSFTYSIVDEHGLFSVASPLVRINITGVNDAPVANADAFNIFEDNSVNGNVFANNGSGADVDVDDLSSFSVALINGLPVPFGVPLELSSHALLTINANGVFSYNPNGAYDQLAQGETAVDSFTYSIVDEHGLSSVASPIVTINITGVNDAPVARADTFNNIPEDGGVNGNLFANNGSGIDFDVDNLSSFTVGKVNGLLANVGSQIILPSGALLTVNADGTFSYDTNGAFNHLAQGAAGVDSFTYSNVDEHNLSSVSSSVVTINIVGVNDTPFTNHDDFTTTEDTNITTRNVFNNNGHDVDGDPDNGFVLTVHEVNGQTANVGTAITLLSGATLTLNGNGTFVYNTNGLFNSMNAGDIITDQFTYRVHDQFGSVSDAPPATVTITVNGVNDAPVARSDAVSTNEDTAINGNVFADNANHTNFTVDYDVDSASTFSVARVNGLSANVGNTFALPSGALLTLNSDGTFSYDPNSSFETLQSGDTATDSFTYQNIDNNSALSNTATVTVTINGVNDTPLLDLNPTSALLNPTGTDNLILFTGPAPLAISPFATITDVDSTTLQSMTIKIENVFDGAQEVLSAITLGTSINAVYVAATGTLTLSGLDTLLNYQQVLRTVKYDNNDTTPTGTDRMLTIQTTDDTGVVSDPAHVTVMMNDSFSTVGNTLLEVGTTPTGDPAVHLSGKLFDNSLGNITANFTGVAAGAVFTLNVDGSFTYLPALNSNVTDVINYSLTTTNSSTTPVSGTITISINNQVWYVDDSAVPGGDGRSSSPFNSLTSVNSGGDVDGSGDYIYIHSGNYSTGPSGFILENSQTLVGEGSALVVGTQTLHAAGVSPVLSNSGGTVIVANDDATVQGITIDGNVAGGAVTITDLTGAVSFDNVNISNAAGAGVVIAQNTSSSLDFSFTNGSITDVANAVVVTLDGTGEFRFDISHNSLGDNLSTVPVETVSGNVIVIDSSDTSATPIEGTINDNTINSNVTSGLFVLNVTNDNPVIAVMNNVYNSGSGQFIDVNAVNGSIDATLQNNIVSGGASVTNSLDAVHFDLDSASDAALLMTNNNFSNGTTTNLSSFDVVGAADFDATLTGNTTQISVAAVSATNSNSIDLDFTNNTFGHVELISGTLGAFRIEDLTASTTIGVINTLTSAGNTFSTNNIVNATEMTATPVGQPVLPNSPGFPLMGMESSIANSSADSISVGQMSGVINAATLLWENAGLTPDQMNALLKLDYHIVDLQGSALATSALGNIFIDGNAAGHGWFVDSSPLDNSEYHADSDSGALQANDSSNAGQHYDLLTALMHEMGHTLGIEDVPNAQGQGLMDEQLALGTRLLPDEANLNFSLVNEPDVQILKLEGDGLIADLRGQNLFHDLNVIDLDGLSSKLGNSVILDANTVINVSDDSHTLTLIGNQSDSVLLPANDQWIMSSQLHNGYQVYTANDAALYVDPHLQTTVI